MTAPILRTDELGPVEILRGDPKTRLLVHCDHGGNAVPRALHDLGLAPEILSRHVGWDIGAAAVARLLAQKFSATAVIARYSRLVVDVNRSLGDLENIPAISDGFVIPGNAALGHDAMEARIKALYWPYHHGIDWELARIKEAGVLPVVLSLHSFTPALMKSHSVAPRPWHCALMFSGDTRLAAHMIQSLQRVPGMTVGINEPYSGVTHGYCLKAHGLAQSLPHAQLEIRQDLICTQAGQEWWASLLAGIMGPILEQSDLKEIRHY